MAVWWPGLSKEIEQIVSACHTCAKVRPAPKETLMAASSPSRPWERVGIDLFELNGKVYIVIVDYYSRWVESRKLISLTSEHTIDVLKGYSRYTVSLMLSALITVRNSVLNHSLSLRGSRIQQAHQSIRRRMAKRNEP